MVDSEGWLSRRAAVAMLAIGFGRVSAMRWVSYCCKLVACLLIELQVEELQDILDPTSSEDEDSQTPDSTSTRSSTHDSFLFSFYPISHSLRNYHPPPEKILILWDAYLENVAPLVTVIHKPIAKRRMAEAAQRCDTLDKNSEALVFSIYLAAVVSMSSEECLNTLGESRDAAVKRYRFAVEQALAKANLLNTQSLVLLQAAVLFLIGVRAADDSKFVWSMTALVLRLAQGLGLHRDGTNFGLSPFETEMRRRLWWHISVLDIRSSEDHGTDFQIHDGMYDTKLPLNVNDEDLSPEMQASPNERAGCTDMTFSLIRFEITNALRHVNCSCPRVRFQAGNNALSSGGCGTMIRCINDRVEQRYLKYCDMSVPLHWVCATVARLILAKLWLIVHHPMTGRRDPERNLTHESRESLFLSSIEVLEFSRLLQLNEYTAKWGWMSHTNTPWHAVAFVLSELCVRPVSPVTDRAWAAASSVYRELDHKQKKGMLWRPLSRLVKRAAAVRAEQQGQMQAQFGDRTAQEGLSQLSNIQDSPTEQVFPQIPIPPLPQGPTSNQSGAPFGTGSGVDFDISKGPIGALNDLFPNTDLLTGANIPSAAQQQFEGMDAPVGISPDMATPIGGQQSMPNTQLSWDDWDQVMRDFQMDVQRAEVRQIGNFSDWFV